LAFVTSKGTETCCCCCREGCCCRGKCAILSKWLSGEEDDEKAEEDDKGRTVVVEVKTETVEAEDGGIKLDKTAVLVVVCIPASNFSESAEVGDTGKVTSMDPGESTIGRFVEGEKLVKIMLLFWLVGLVLVFERG
jgi:hypothetical protein